MSSNVEIWQSKHYKGLYPWLRKNLPPGTTRAEAFASDVITSCERQTLAGIGDDQEHNEKLLFYFERTPENYPCLVHIISEMPGCEEEADRLRQALPPPSPQFSQHLGCAAVAEQLKLECQQHKPLPVSEPHRLPKTPLELEPKAKHRPSPVHTLDTLASGEAASEAESLERDVRSSPPDFVASHSCSDNSMDSVEDKCTVKFMKVRIFRKKHRPSTVQECVGTLREKYKVKVESKIRREDTSIREQWLESGDADEKESYDRDMATLKIVVGVERRTTEEEKERVAENVKNLLRKECGIKLVIVNVEEGSVIIYALTPVEDLIRLYKIATYQPGVLAGLGLVEISTLGRSTAISLKSSPGGPGEEPIHPSLQAFVGYMVPSQAHFIMASSPNMHHVVRALVANLPADGKALTKVIKWLEEHRNDVFHTPSLFAMDPEGDQSGSGVPSISTTSPSISGKVGDSTTKKGELGLYESVWRVRKQCVEFRDKRIQQLPWWILLIFTFVAVMLIAYASNVSGLSSNAAASAGNGSIHANEPDYADIGRTITIPIAIAGVVVVWLFLNAAAICVRHRPRKRRRSCRVRSYMSQGGEGGIEPGNSSASPNQQQQGELVFYEYVWRIRKRYGEFRMMQRRSLFWILLILITATVMLSACYSNNVVLQSRNTPTFLRLPKHCCNGTVKMSCTRHEQITTLLDDGQVYHLHQISSPVQFYTDAPLPGQTQRRSVTVRWFNAQLRARNYSALFVITGTAVEIQGGIWTAPVKWPFLVWAAPNFDNASTQFQSGCMYQVSQCTRTATSLQEPEGLTPIELKPVPRSTRLTESRGDFHFRIADPLSASELQNVRYQLAITGTVFNGSGAADMVLPRSGVGILINSTDIIVTMPRTSATQTVGFLVKFRKVVPLWHGLVSEYYLQLKAPGMPEAASTESASASTITPASPSNGSTHQTLGKPECLKLNCSTYGRCAPSPSGPSCKCFVGDGCRYSCNPEDWRADAYGAEIDAKCDYTKKLFCNSPQANSTYWTANGKEVGWATQSYEIEHRKAEQGETVYSCWQDGKKVPGMSFTLIVRGEVRLDPEALENLKHVVNTSVVEAPILPCVPEPICSWEPVGDPNRAGCILIASSCVLNITEAGVSCAGTYRLVAQNKYNMNPLIIDVNYLSRSPTANKDHVSYYVDSICAFAVVAVVALTLLVAYLLLYLLRSMRGRSRVRRYAVGPLPMGDEREDDHDADPHHQHANGDPSRVDLEHGDDRLHFPVPVVHADPGAVVRAGLPRNVPSCSHVPLQSRGSPRNAVDVAVLSTPVECTDDHPQSPPPGHSVHICQ